MLELLNDHLSEILIGLFTLLGVLIPTLYNHYKAKRERQDKYFFAMIEKRFEIYSHASYLCDQLKHLIHKPDDDGEKNEKITKALDWYSQYNLYLEPEIRQSFSEFIHKVDTHYATIEEWRYTGQQKGWNAEQTKEKNEELNSAFHEIMYG